jgi:hypothetical protein
MEERESRKSASPSQLVDARIEELGDWRGEMLGRLRAVVKAADPDIVEEYSSLDGNTRCAIDFHEGETIDEEALKDLVRAAVALNT